MSRKKGGNRVTGGENRGEKRKWRKTCQSIWKGVEVSFRGKKGVSLQKEKKWGVPPSPRNKLYRKLEGGGEEAGTEAGVRTEGRNEQMAWDRGLGIGGLYSGLKLASKCLHTSSYQAFFLPACSAIFQLRKLFAYLGSSVYANRARYGEREEKLSPWQLAMPRFYRLKRFPDQDKEAFF